MSLLLECDGCEARYDVSERQPGKKVRCPKCRTVLVVPEREPGDDVTGSQRLRKARGPMCSQHKTTPSSGACQLCKARTCVRCASPAPVDHTCKTCAAELGLGGALPVDFGFLATYRLALSVFFNNLLRLLAWNVISSLGAAVVCSIPGVIGVVMVLSAGGIENLSSSLTAQAGGSLVVGALVFYWVLVNFLLLPAGCAVFIDQAIRGRKLPFGAAFAETWRRVIRNTGSLFLIFLVYGLLTLLLLMPGLILFYYSALAVGAGSPLPVALLVLELGLGLLFLAAGLGMAVPVAILEQRSAFESLGRSWELAGQRFWQLTGLLVVFALAYAAFSVGSAALGRATVPLVALTLTGIVDLFWPALLVSAYHGLAAEHAGVLGRGKA